MNDPNPFLILPQACYEAIAWVAQHVIAAGLQVVRTFDLQAARQGPTECPCPHHGTNNCDCQVVVLLVYGEDHQPVSLVAHGHEDTTWFSLVDTPQQRPDPRLERALRQALNRQDKFLSMI